MVKYSGQRAKLGNYQQRNAYAEGLLDLVVRNQEAAAKMDRDFAALAAQEETNRKERKAQEELFANQQFARAEQDAAAIYKVDLGSNKTNQNFHDYLFGMKEQSYKIRTLQREGKISSSEAAQAIAELNQKVQGTMDEAIAVTVQADALRKGLEIPPGQPGAISSRTPDGVQQALLGMKTGESKYVRRNNVTYAVRENPNDPKNPYVANLTQIAKDSADGKDAFATVPDLTEAYKNAYNNVVKPSGVDNADLITFQEKRVGSEMATVKYMTPQQRTKAVNAMVKAGQFNNLLDDEERMKSVWADLMGKDTDWMNVEGNNPEEIEANIQKQRQEAAMFLANKALEENAAPDGVKLFVKSKKYQAPGSGSGSSTGPRVTVATEEAINTYSKDYQDIANNASKLVGKPKDVVKEANRINRGDVGYYTKDQLIAKGVDQDIIDTLDDNYVYPYTTDDGGKVSVDANSGFDINNVDDITTLLGQALMGQENDAVLIRLQEKYPTKQTDPTDDEPLDFKVTKQKAKEKKEQEQKERTRQKDIRKAEDELYKPDFPLNKI